MQKLRLIERVYESVYRHECLGLCTMNIKQGYKQTAIGIIPEDWEVTSLKKVLSKIIDNRGKTPPYSKDSGIELIESASISFVNQYPDYSKVNKFVSKSTYDFWFRGHPVKHDILISTVREYSGSTAIINENRGTIAQNLIALRINELNPNYVFYWTKSNSFKKQLDQVMMNQAQPSLRVPWLLNFQLIYPLKLQEQTAIATALSDIDALIGELDKLIAKKQGIKQATMQQLLTGKKRLSGFSGEWEVKKIGELVFDFRGGAPLAPSDFVNIGHLVLPKGAVTKGGFLRVEQEKIQYCSHKYAESHKNNVVDKNYTIVVLRDLVPSGPTIGLMVKFINDNTYVLAQGVYGFRVDETKANPDFLIQLSNSKEYRQVMQNTMVGSTQVHITNGAFKNVEIYLPSIKEQTAIANILSDMDAEISQLEGRRAKMGELKQGMMQELLTGRIRLNTQDSTRC